MNDIIANKTFDEIEIGDQASLTRTLNHHDVGLTSHSALIALHPAHQHYLTFGQGGGQAGWSTTLFAHLASTRLPGFGSVTRRIETRLHLPMALDPPVSAIGIVKEKWPTTGIILLDCKAMDASGKVVASGSIEVLAPKEKIRHNPVSLATLIHPHDQSDYSEAVCG